MANKLVRLVMSASEETSDEDAVLHFIETITARGLRGFAYRVEDAETGEVFGVYNGYGQPFELADAAKALAMAGAAEVEPTADEDVAEGESVEDKPVETDDELLSLSEHLNDELPA